MDTTPRIKIARQDRNLTQKQLADLLGVSVQAVSQWETGRTTPSVHNFSLLSEFLRADFDWLRGDAETNSKEIVPSSTSKTFGDKSPIVKMRDTIPFVRGMMPQNVERLETSGLVQPTRAPRGRSFAIQLGDANYLDSRFRRGDLLIFDNGVDDQIGDIVLSAILLPGGKYDIALTEVIQNGVDPDGALSADIRPLTSEGREMYDTLGTLFYPVVAVMVEHRRFRPD